LPGEVVDITPHIDICKRGKEIQFWLNNNEVKKYVIIDDDVDMLKKQKNNFVRTSKNNDHNDCIDDGYGLTKKCSEMVVEILNK